MDYSAKLPLRILLMILIIPTLLWGYGRAIVRFAQNGVNAGGVSANVHGSDGRDRTSNRREGTTSEDSDNSRPHAKIATPIKLPSENHLVSKPDANGAISDKSTPTLKSASENADKTDLNVPQNTIQDNVFEQVGEAKTYNSVRVRKPVIPATIGISSSQEQSRASQEASARTSIMQVLGIPTVLFAGLFFVMWGIISGRIQRVMF